MTGKLEEDLKWVGLVPIFKKWKLSKNALIIMKNPRIKPRLV